MFLNVFIDFKVKFFYYVYSCIILLWKIKFSFMPPKIINEDPIEEVKCPQIAVIFLGIYGRVHVKVSRLNTHA